MIDVINDDLRRRATAAATSAGQSWTALQDDVAAFIAAAPELRADPKLMDLPQQAYSAIGWVGLRLAAADGPLDDEAARLLNLVGGRNLTAAGYMNALNSDKADPLADSVDTLARFMQVARAQQRGLPGFDVRAGDRVIDAVQDTADALFLADGRVSLHEAEVLADVVGALRTAAASLGEPAGLPGSGAPQEVPCAPPGAGAGAGAAPVADGLAELHGLIGLASVKRQVETLVNLARQIKLRREHGLPTPKIAFHSAFTGRPGTGKTTVARIVARIYKELGLISKGQLVETDRSGLVAGFVGQTAAKVASVVESAEGGVLFIDEAYALSPAGGNDYGGEAIETLLKLMEDKRDDLIVIAAGYSDRMQTFLSANPGLRSRFPNIISFPDYSVEEMVAIFQNIASANGYTLDAAATAALDGALSRIDRTSDEFANGRDVRNLFERVISAQADRLASITDAGVQTLQALTREDITSAAGSDAPAAATQASPKAAAKDLSWLDAVITVLRDAPGPLSYTTIADRIVAGRLKARTGANPAASVAAVISASLDDEASPLVRVKRGEDALQRQDAASRTAG